MKASKIIQIPIGLIKKVAKWLVNNADWILPAIIGVIDKLKKLIKNGKGNSERKT